MARVVPFRCTAGEQGPEDRSIGPPSSALGAAPQRPHTAASAGHHLRRGRSQATTRAMFQVLVRRATRSETGEDGPTSPRPPHPEPTESPQDRQRSGGSFGEFTNGTNICDVVPNPQQWWRNGKIGGPAMGPCLRCVFGFLTRFRYPSMGTAFAFGDDDELNINPPTSCHWQAPAKTKTQRPWPAVGAEAPGPRARGGGH